MIKNFVLLPFLVLIVTFGATAQGPHATTLVRSNSKATYNDLLARLKGGDLGIDFKELRVKYAETKEYDPNGLAPQIRDRMYKAINEKRYEDARSIAEEVLRTNYVDISAHLVSGIANEALGNTAKFQFHKEVFTGLISSILDEADGKSAGSGYTVISIPEEYAVLDYLRLKRDGQSSTGGDGHQYDVFSVTDTESGETLKLYFNIDIIWKVRNRVFKN